MKKLTVGMPTYDDYDGVYFSMQAIRMYHKEVLDYLELIVVDNNPESNHGRETANFCNGNGIKYVPFDKYKSTSVKNLVFENSTCDYVLCMDSHVFIEQGALAKLIKFYDENPNTPDLYQGPLVYDDLNHISTHFDPVWSTGMYGIWNTDPRGVDKDGEKFEIPAQGMGLFTTKKRGWLGFSKRFRGFGGEEYYIHEKYRQMGRKCWCLPFLRWVHRFGRPNGTAYPNVWEDRIANYIIGWQELSLDMSEMLNHFKDHVGEAPVRNVCQSFNINFDNYINNKNKAVEPSTTQGCGCGK